MWWGVVGNPVIGLVVWLVEYHVGCLFALVCSYVQLFGSLSYLMGVYPSGACCVVSAPCGVCCGLLWFAL